MSNQRFYSLICRLHFPEELVEDGREKASYDVDSGKLSSQTTLLSDVDTWPWNNYNMYIAQLLMYITNETTFSHAYSTQRRPHTGIIAIPMYIKSVKGQFG